MIRISQLQDDDQKDWDDPCAVGKIPIESVIRSSRAHRDTEPFLFIIYIVADIGREDMEPEISRSWNGRIGSLPRFFYLHSIRLKGHFSRR